MSASAAEFVDWEDDERMLRLQERKRKLEEDEPYNMDEVMVKKRKAVVELAKRTPALKASTECAPSSTLYRLCAPRRD